MLCSQTTLSLPQHVPIKLGLDISDIGLLSKILDVGLLGSSKILDIGLFLTILDIQ